MGYSYFTFQESCHPTQSWALEAEAQSGKTVIMKDPMNYWLWWPSLLQPGTLLRYRFSLNPIGFAELSVVAPWAQWLSEKKRAWMFQKEKPIRGTMVSAPPPLPTCCYPESLQIISFGETQIFIPLMSSKCSPCEVLQNFLFSSWWSTTQGCLEWGFPKLRLCLLSTVTHKYHTKFVEHIHTFAICFFFIPQSHFPFRMQCWWCAQDTRTANEITF